MSVSYPVHTERITNRNRKDGGQFEKTGNKSEFGDQRDADRPFLHVHHRRSSAERKVLCRQTDIADKAIRIAAYWEGK